MGKSEPVAMSLVGPDGVRVDLDSDDIEKARQRLDRHLKETPADRGVSDRAFAVSADELRSFVERYERLAAEKADLADHQKEVMAEAKSRGYDTKVIRRIIAMRKKTRDELAEEEAVLDLYRSALGM